MPLLIIGLTGVYVLINFLRFSVNPFDFRPLKGEAEGRINILVLGVGDPGHAGQQLSDTNMIVSINTQTNQVAYISVPRDLRVRIPGYGYGKINQANSDGGVTLSEQVAEQTFGVPIDYYAVADFTGLKEAVDAVGGVDINNKEQLYDPEYPCDNNQYKSCGFLLKPGQYHMNGALALKYARCRKGTCGNDFGRALRQQEVLQQVKSKALSAGTLINPLRLNSLSQAVGDNIKTDLSVNQLIKLSKLIKATDQNPSISYVFSTEKDGLLVSDPAGSSDLLPLGGTYAPLAERVQTIFTNPPTTDQQQFYR